MKTRRQLWWRKEKSGGKDERIAWPECTHIAGISIHYFPKDVAV